MESLLTKTSLSLEEANAVNEEANAVNEETE
jgi:hypothetical protein